MSLPAVYLPAAEEDMAGAHSYYEQQRAGLGDQFVAAVREAVEAIGQNPQMYGLFRRDLRAAPLHQFPYVVYYRDRGSDILVVAVQHGSRSSRAWGGRA